MNSSKNPAEPWSWRRGLFQAALVAIVMLASLGVYMAVLWWRGPQAQINTRTVLDDPIPFQYGWVWVYMVPYLLGPLAAALMSWDTLVWFLKRAVIVALISDTIFIGLPTKTDPHPVNDVAGDGLTARLYRNMAEADGPAANAAPSLHVSLSCLLALAMIRCFPHLWPVWMIAVVLIWLSTLFTRQHHMVDVLTGASLAMLVAIPWRNLGSGNSANPV
jgi:membrane-associated phospholipid phosphatase